MSQTSHYCDTRPTATKVTCLHQESFPREVCRSVPSLAPDMSEVSHRAWAQLSGWPGQGWCPDHSGHAGASVSGREFCCHTVCVLARRMGTRTRGDPNTLRCGKGCAKAGGKTSPAGSASRHSPPECPVGSPEGGDMSLQWNGRWCLFTCFLCFAHVYMHHSNFP